MLVCIRVKAPLEEASKRRLISAAGAEFSARVGPFQRRDHRGEGLHRLPGDLRDARVTLGLLLAFPGLREQAFDVGPGPGDVD